MMIQVYDPIYKNTLLVGIGETDKAVVRRLEKLTKYKLTNEEAGMLAIRGDARSVIFEGGNRVMRLPKYAPTPYWIATLAHEAYHVATFLTDHVGIKRSEASDEAVAYEVEFAVRKILEKVMRRRK